MHSHVLDIDARFSKISHKWKERAAKTIPELLDVIAGSIEEGIEAAEMKQIFDVKFWLSPYLNDIQKHSYPHVYRYVRP